MNPSQKSANCLKRFVHGYISTSELEDCLRGCALFKFWDTNQRAIDRTGGLPSVEFTRNDIDAQLRRFLANDLSARELSDWAAALRLLGCFEVDKHDDRSSEVWDLIDELMSPDVWGPLTVDSVLDLRRRLG